MNTVVVAIILTLLALAGIPCETAGTPEPEPGGQPQPDREVVSSNIDDAALVAADGAAELVLQVGLPNACYEYLGYEVSQQAGQPVRVDVFSMKIVGPYACAEIYLTEEVRVALEGIGRVELWDELEFVLNGEPRRLTAQSDAGPR